MPSPTPISVQGAVRQCPVLAAGAPEPRLPMSDAAVREIVERLSIYISIYVYINICIIRLIWMNPHSVKG